jgi:putative membrane protein
VGLLVRFLLNALSLWVATAIYPGAVRIQNTETLLLAAVVLGLVNAFLRPVVLILTLPLNVLTLGLFTLVVNTLMLYVVVWLLHIPHGGFLSLFVLSLLVTVVSVLVGRLVAA